jgi:hypothetical protein
MALYHLPALTQGKLDSLYRNNEHGLFCHAMLTLEISCKKNYEKTSYGMEAAGALNIFNCPPHTQGICYTKYLGDGNSKAFRRVVAEKSYGPKLSITTLECVGHVKRNNGRKTEENFERKNKYKISRRQISWRQKSSP